ncbi:MAG: phage holin family protein [Dehalococcoidia bacterium]
MLFQKTSHSGGFFQRLIVEFLVGAGAFCAAGYAIPGIHPGGWKTVLIIALIIGAVNVILNPVLAFIVRRFRDFTIGVITVVVNTVMLYLMDWFDTELGISFQIDNPWSAFLGALIIIVIVYVLNKALR